MKQLWTIDLSTNRRIKNYFLKENNVEAANSVEHTYSKYEGKTISLLTLDELVEMKANDPEKVLISIFGEEIFARNADEDTRMGYVASGVLV